MNNTITSKDLKDSLNQLQGTPIENKEPEFNLIYINTPRGKMVIKTLLTAKEWLQEQNLRLTNLPTKKKAKCKRK